MPVTMSLAECNLCLDHSRNGSELAAASLACRASPFAESVWGMTPLQSEAGQREGISMPWMSLKVSASYLQSFCTKFNSAPFLVKLESWDIHSPFLSLSDVLRFLHVGHDLQGSVALPKKDFFQCNSSGNICILKVQQQKLRLAQKAQLVQHAYTALSRCVHSWNCREVIFLLPTIYVR